MLLQSQRSTDHVYFNTRKPLTPRRTCDPDPYGAAMKAALGASKVRPVVLELVREHGPLTHDELIDWYRRLLAFEEGTPRASDSGIRTRLRELVKAGLIVEDAEEGESLFGNRAKRWVSIDMLEGLISDDSYDQRATDTDDD
ncbi:hypothetical protein [Arthrobacter sp. efr-133-TYG-118]|uniref:hypothetical protein n=1 Tax=Arthrobacter sp. efr-133-TYG-118 TaxID=3040279 RepID=UPI00254CD089|nr:hypothetical protein [Arthrobacter sp. efr-133-TYG-118]